MSKQSQSTGAAKSKRKAALEPAPIQCHFISNTHWDREWRYSMQRTRFQLVYMMDMLLDIFEKEPKFKSFHLDSQTIPLLDYLEIRPEREKLIRKYIKNGRLLVGPWFVLPDEFCVGGEALIRNLLLGHKIARRFGAVSKTGYSPFSWGQISQMPQIYSGFGIPFAAFYRGVNTLVAPNSEFFWEGPDGTRIVGSRLARRPRYNVWYVLQRPVFWNIENIGNRLVRWDAGHGPFRFANPDFANFDIQYAHPKFAYYAENVAARTRQAIDEQNGEWTTPHRFWSAGHDSSCPDIREVRLMADCAEALAGEADVFHSTFPDFQKCVVESAPKNLPVARGEMRHFFTAGSSSTLFGWVTSARMDIKMENCGAERALGVYAEPAAVCASLLGAAYPQGFVDVAWNWLLQNHGHDSIGGCSRDVVPNDMFYRYRQSREISACVLERALMDVAGAIDLSKRDPGEVAVVAWNPVPAPRTEVVPLELDLPVELKAADFELVDEKGAALPIQRVSARPVYTMVQSPVECANMIQAMRHTVHAQLPDVPGMGYRAFFVKPLRSAKRQAKQGMATGPQAIENEFLSVAAQSNGALTVRDKASGCVWQDLGYFRDTSEMGNPWERTRVPNDELLTTLTENARVAIVADGELVASIRVELDWALPRGRSSDDLRRSEERVVCRIVNTVTLRRGQPWVEIVTEVDNQAEDHYLQVSFPTGVQADHVMAQIPFDVVSRPIAKPDPALFAEEVQTEHPMDFFVDISDGERGVALLNDGLKAYEPHGDADNTLSLTLLRCFPLRMCITELERTDYSKIDKGSQLLGRHTFRYAFMPHAGDWEQAGLWQAAQRFTFPFRAIQIGPTPRGNQPLSRSFLEVEPPSLHVSALKRSESSEGWIVRLFNPTSKTVKARLRLNGGGANPAQTQSPVERQAADFALPVEPPRPWSKVRAVTLEEIPEADLKQDKKGWVAVTLGRKKIYTIEFLP
ncbi:MAG: glycosyl hydrolase-related protein [Candidatus Sumerlaeota bacterium]|nr:glycosyl hydrolase-related protein [Candidatus Sumerlaeota bacterium]